MSGNGDFWHPVAGRLPAHWERGFISWPGFGNVPASPDVASFDAMVEMAVAQGLRRPSAVVAQSMGCVMAIRVAARVPELVSRLVLCAAPAGVAPLAAGADDWRALPQDERPPAPAWAFAPTLDLSVDLRPLTMPVLLLWATRDAISPLVVGEALAQGIPGARLETFDTDDHRFPQSRADDVARAIGGFLAGTPAVATPG